MAVHIFDLESLATSTLTFDHTDVTPGLYSYYVETIDTTNGCVSQNRLKKFERTQTHNLTNHVNRFIFQKRIKLVINGSF